MNARPPGAEVVGVPDAGDENLIAATLEMARQRLGMDAAHLGRFIYGFEEIVEVVGDAERFGLSAGLRVPFVETICRRMVMGRVPNLVPDTSAEPALAALPAVREGVVRAYAGVPVTASDGSEFGAICCVSAETEPGLSPADLEFLRTIGKLLGDRLQHADIDRRLDGLSSSDEATGDRGGGDREGAARPAGESDPA